MPRRTDPRTPNVRTDDLPEDTATDWTRAPGALRARDARARIGRLGEDIAARYLTDLGWRLLDRNWRPRTGLRGELDIVALDPGEVVGDGAPARPGRSGRPAALVVVEVKTRSSTAAGQPAEAVTGLKLGKLRSLAAAWMAQRADQVRQDEPGTGPTPPGSGAQGLRLDVVSILLRPGGPAGLRHHRGVGL